MAGPNKDYTIGKGRLYFDQFAPGTTSGMGERYFGNTPELTNSAETETLDHYDADQGLNVKDESITTENNLSGSFVTDHISPENIALWYTGTTAPITQLAATAQTDTITQATRGRSYQLGITEATPTGVRHVNNVVVKKGGSAVADVDTNFEIDLDKGRVFIETDAPDVVDNDTLTVEYDIKPSSRTVIVGKGDEVRGALRFLSANPVGTQKDYFWPYVKITPNGDFALKGSEWMQLGFSFEVLKLSGKERVYVEAGSTLSNTAATGLPTITGTAQVGQVLTVDTAAIVDPDGISGGFTHQWKKASVDIAGATTNTYTPVAGDVGAVLSCAVSYTDDLGGSQTLETAPTTAVIA
jgi:hypothetical protein